MLTVIRNDKGDILGACEWRIVNQHGLDDKDGLYVYISNIEISKSAQHNGVIKKFILPMALKAPNAIWMYFKRKKYKRRQRFYPIHKWTNLLRPGG